MNVFAGRLLPWLVGGLIACCGAAVAAPPRAIQQTTANDCVFSRTVDDWRALDDRNLIVWAPPRTAYQVSLGFPLQELRFTDSVAFVDGNRDGRICGFGGDDVLIGGAVPQQATIIGMQRLDAAQLAALLGERTATRNSDEARYQ